MVLRSLLFLNLGLLIAALVGVIFPLQTFWLAVLVLPILFASLLLLLVGLLWLSAKRRVDPSRLTVERR